MNKIDNIQISDKELVNLIKGMPKVAKKNGWIFSFDKDEDAMFYSPDVIPNDTELYQVRDEFAVYVDKKKQLQGVMSEYFNNNFVQHHKSFKPLMERIFDKNKKDDIEDIDPSKEKDKDVEIFKDLFEKTLIVEASEVGLHP